MPPPPPGRTEASATQAVRSPLPQAVENKEHRGEDMLPCSESTSREAEVALRSMPRLSSTAVKILGPPG